MHREFFETFILVFVAEMGDKTQLLLMTLAAKYSSIQILAGILLGVLLNHGTAVYIGSFISTMTEKNIIQMFIGAMLIFFGILIILYEEEDKNERYYSFGPVLTTAITFFLGEMGDKTQLTCMALSMEATYPAIVLSGSVLAMMTMGLAGIIIGTSLTKHIPSYIIKPISGLIFIIFGIIRLIE